MYEQIRNICLSYCFIVIYIVLQCFIVEANNWQIILQNWAEEWGLNVVISGKAKVKQMKSKGISIS